MGGFKRTAKAIRETSAETAKRRDVADAIVRKTTVDQVASMALAHAQAPLGIVSDYGANPLVDDGEPPSPPANVAALPILHGLSISWDLPPADDKAKAAEVRITPEVGSAFEVPATKLTGHAALGLAGGVPCDVEVRIVDVYGVPGDWCAPITATPSLSVAEQIDLDELAMLERIQGLLPNQHLAKLEDATKLGDGIVLARAMAVQDAAAMNLWVADAAIQSAKIGTIAVDKLIGGIIETNDIFVASTLKIASGGELVAGTGTKIDSGGLTIDAGTSYVTTAFTRDYKLCPPSEWAALGFFDDTFLALRGIGIRADGLASQRGSIALHATTGGDLGAFGSARMDIISSSAPGVAGQVQIYQNLLVNGTSAGYDFISSNGVSLRAFGGPGSVNFKGDYTPAERQRTIALRKTLEGITNHSHLSKGETEALVGLVLDLARQLIDDPKQRAEERERELARDYLVRHRYYMRHRRGYRIRWNHEREDVPFEAVEDPEGVRALEETPTIEQIHREYEPGFVLTPARRALMREAG